MKNGIFYSMVVILLAVILYFQFAGVNGLAELNSAEFENAMATSNQILIDVREPSELAQGYIPGALNIPVGQIENRLQEIPKDRSVLLYCRSGNRSKQAAQVLLDNGYEQVSHLTGGIKAWNGTVTR
jgi:rhodanese-related sulfurtransferase